MTFLEPCSEVNVDEPQTGWVHTVGAGPNMLVTLGGYDVDDDDLELVRVQYRRTQGDGAWINIAEVMKADLGPVFEIVTWETATLQDGEFEIRAVAQCFGGLNPGISKVVKGKIEREPPEIFGTPEPADGVYSAGDEISVTFNEEIRCDLLIQADQFDNNNVGLYNTRTGDLVDAVITCSGDKILVPNVPNQLERDPARRGGRHQGLGEQQLRPRAVGVRRRPQQPELGGQRAGVRLEIRGGDQVGDPPTGKPGRFQPSLRDHRASRRGCGCSPNRAPWRRGRCRP